MFKQTSMIQKKTRPLLTLEDFQNCYRSSLATRLPQHLCEYSLNNESRFQTSLLLRDNKKELVSKKDVERSLTLLKQKESFDKKVHEIKEQLDHKEVSDMKQELFQRRLSTKGYPEELKKRLATAILKETSGGLNSQPPTLIEATKLDHKEMNEARAKQVMRFIRNFDAFPFLQPSANPLTRKRNYSTMTIHIVHSTSSVHDDPFFDFLTSNYSHFIRCHYSLNTAFQKSEFLAGDLVLLMPGNHGVSQGQVDNIELIGLGVEPSDVVIHNIGSDDVSESILTCTGSFRLHNLTVKALPTKSQATHRNIHVKGRFTDTISEITKCSIELGTSGIQVDREILVLLIKECKFCNFAQGAIIADDLLFGTLAFDRNEIYNCSKGMMAIYEDAISVSNEDHEGALPVVGIRRGKNCSGKYLFRGNHIYNNYGPAIGYINTGVSSAMPMISKTPPDKVEEGYLVFDLIPYHETGEELNQLEQFVDTRVMEDHTIPYNNCEKNKLGFAAVCSYQKGSLQVMWMNCVSDGGELEVTVTLPPDSFELFMTPFGCDEILSSKHFKLFVDRECSRTEYYVVFESKLKVKIHDQEMKDIKHCRVCGSGIGMKIEDTPLDKFISQSVPFLQELSLMNQEERSISLCENGHVTICIPNVLSGDGNRRGSHIRSNA